jgi:lipopolysaccharide export system protein LptA
MNSPPLICRLAYRAAAAMLAAAVFAAAGPATAGPAAGEGQHPAGPFQGANQNKDQPIQIESSTLEVRDKSKIATFAGNVQVVQGDTTIHCRTLVVFYGPEEGAAAAKTAAPASVPANANTGLPQDAHDIRRVEARGDVTVVTKDQNASGDLGVYDLKAKTITLTGNVVVSQGKNVVRGDRVVVDTETGFSRVESAATPTATTPSRVRALILPGKGANGGPSNMMTLGPGHN